MSLFIYFCSTTASSEDGWYWTAANGVNNAAYSEDVQVAEFIRRWFNSGDDKHYQT
jgi:hypothetical protein